MVYCPCALTSVYCLHILQLAQGALTLVNTNLGTVDHLTAQRQLFLCLDGHAALVEALQILDGYLDADVLAGFVEVGGGSLKTEAVGNNLVAHLHAVEEIHGGTDSACGVRQIVVRTTRITPHRTCGGVVVAETELFGYLTLDLWQPLIAAGIEQHFALLDLHVFLANVDIVRYGILDALVKCPLLGMGGNSD